MSYVLKINYDNLDEELKRAGARLFETKYTIEVVDEADKEHPEASEEIEPYNIIYINNRDEKGNELHGSVTLERIHEQYDFESETLFYFYNIVSYSDDSILEKFEKVAGKFNKQREEDLAVLSGSFEGLQEALNYDLKSPVEDLLNSEEDDEE